MAFNAKTLGILSGLGVGLTGGVFLAALNPMIPQTDTTRIAETPQTVVVGEPTDDVAPELADSSDAEATTITQADKPDVSEAEEVPATDRDITRNVVAGQVGELAEIKGEENSKVALLAPDDAPNESSVIDALQEPGADPAPDLSTKPAVPVAVSKPASDVATTVTDPAQPDTGGAAGVETPETDPETAADTPARIDPAPQKATELPDVQTESAAPVEETPEEDDAIATEGTFDTAKSRLPTIGEDNSGGFAARKKVESGLKLPTIGKSEETTAPADAGSAQQTGALQRNAVAFGETDKPLMSIVLMDAGENALAPEKLTKLILPAAFAVQVDGDQPATKARMYRKAGFEVLALSPRSVELSLSGGQSTDQVSEVLDKIFTIMPEAVGLIDRPSADLQKNRKLSRAVIESFRDSGHGLVTYSQGLNSIPRDASLAKVPAASVYRVLDGNGENPSVIERYLNRAVQDARRNGHVIVMGTTAPETVTTIVNWSLSTKARAVTIAPVSASLLRTVE